MQFLGFYSLSNVTQTILPVVDSPVVEHLTTHPEIKGLKQARVLPQEKMTEKKK
jgi:hypothetical protein